MSGGEPSSIKQKPSCAVELPISSYFIGHAVGSVVSNLWRTVLWGAVLQQKRITKQADIISVCFFFFRKEGNDNVSSIIS